MVDIATGATAHSAILEALIAWYHGSGNGDHGVDVDVMADWLTVPVKSRGRTPKRVSWPIRQSRLMGCLKQRTANDLISIQSDREWDKLCERLGDLILSHDSLFASNVKRVEHLDVTDKIVAEAFCNAVRIRPWQLTKADVAFALLNDMAGLSAHPCAASLLKRQMAPSNILHPPRV